MKKKTGSTFAEDWAKNTYTGRAVKSVVEHLREPAYRPGKGDRLTTNPDAVPKKENYFSAKRLKRL